MGKAGTQSDRRLRNQIDHRCKCGHGWWTNKLRIILSKKVGSFGAFRKCQGIRTWLHGVPELAVPYNSASVLRDDDRKIRRTPVTARPPAFHRTDIRPRRPVRPSITAFAIQRAEHRDTRPLPRFFSTSTHEMYLLARMRMIYKR